MKTAIFTTIATAALALAAPTCQGKQQVAKYDNLKTIPAASQLSPITKYMGLNYTSFNVLQTGVAGVNEPTGVLPESGDQIAATGVVNNILKGNPALNVLAPYKSFTLEYLYFGCVANSVISPTGVPIECTISFTGYKPGSTKPYKTINQSFNPSNTLSSNMTKAVFPKTFAKLGRVDLAIVSSPTTATLTAFDMDNLAYELYKC